MTEIVAHISKAEENCFDQLSSSIGLDAEDTRFFEDDSVEILVKEVLKAESIVEAETAREPGVGLAKHLLHLLLVPFLAPLQCSRPARRGQSQQA
jgi:hypothetical protein